VPSPSTADGAVVDGHSDLLLELCFAEREHGEDNPLASRWLGPLRRGGVALQVCAIYVEPELPQDEALREVLHQARVFNQAVRSNPEAVVAVRSAADLGAVGGGRVGLMLALEGAWALGSDPLLIDVLADLGVRMASLTWNERNAFAAGCGADGGLTDLGARLVDRIVDRGLVLDLAHASAQTFWEVLERGVADVVVSHAACRALHDHPRNLPDDQLRALADHDGVLGLMPHPLTVGRERATLDGFAEHVEHAVSAMGIGHVALGGDFLRQIERALGQGDEVIDGVRVDAAIEGLEGPQDYPRFADLLRARGWEERDVAALLGGNLRALMGRVLGR
jgi:membrane dipeptidase